MSWSAQPCRSDGLAYRTNCYRCFKPEVACICDSIEQVLNRTGIIILQHPRERFHPIGTARIARLALAKVRVEPCAPWSDGSVIQSKLPPQTALLYPAPGARNLATLSVAERPRHLVLLDGTWFHAKKMYDAHGWLQTLPHVSLTPSEPSRYRLRREPKQSYVATIEAVACALRLLEPETAGLDGLLRTFTAMIDRQAVWAPLPQ
jgi:DTW domain-containing protein YfiP